MTREDYLALKDSVKQLAAELKFKKVSFKQWQREHNGCSSWNCEFNPGKAYWEYRSRHIFLSLVRGKKRDEIEWNVFQKDREISIEERIAKLCEIYNYEINYDESGRVIELKEVEIAEKVGA